MILTLPPKTRQLVDRYLNLRIGKRLIQCPYYENITKKRSRPVFVGKGLPEEIEKETITLFKKLKWVSSQHRPDWIRFSMVMAGLGIDCSGLVVRLLDCFLKEKGLLGIISAVQTNTSGLVQLTRLKLKPYTTISANFLTGDTNCIIVNNHNDIVPGDLIRFGKQHVALITEVEKSGEITKSFSYCVSTSEYNEKHGVRIGKINILHPKEELGKQQWLEVFRGTNWTKIIYLSSELTDRGIRRLRILDNTTS